MAQIFDSCNANLKSHGTKCLTKRAVNCLWNSKNVEMDQQVGFVPDQKRVLNIVVDERIAVTELLL